jgi:hypothetical protein
MTCSGDGDESEVCVMAAPVTILVVAQVSSVVGDL